MTSSIAAGNAQASAIAAGLPIAQSDAARYGSVADQNMAATNTAGQFNAGATLSAHTADANAANTAGQYNAGTALSVNTNDANAKNTAGQFNAGAQNAMTGANMSAVNSAAATNAAAENNMSQFNTASANSAAATNAGAVNASSQFNAASSNAAAQQNASLPIEREQEMTTILNGIYSNPNLTAAEQSQAASNAKAVMAGLYTATNATFAAGTPSIFGAGNAPAPQPVTPNAAYAPTSIAPTYRQAKSR
jgi:hypothetical protein